MKWHNLNIGIKISINTGAAALLWAAGFFRMLWMAQDHPSIERLFPVAMGGWTAGLITILLKKNADDKLDVQVAKAGTGDKVNRIKVQAAGGNPAPVDKG